MTVVQAIQKEDSTNAQIAIKSEKDLLEELKKINSKITSSTLRGYHEIGTKITFFYQKKYGKGEIKRIAKVLGMKPPTLYKAIQTADIFSVDDITLLIAYGISWNRLRDSLSLGREAILKVAKESQTVSEFSQRIRELKAEAKLETGKKETCPRRTKSPTKKDLAEKVQTLEESLKEKEQRIQSLENERTNGPEMSLIDMTDKELQFLQDMVTAELNCRKKNCHHFEFNVIPISVANTHEAALL